MQLPFAGIENFVHLLDDEHVWACGKGVYAEPVAELALTLGLAGLRGLATYSRAQAWEPPQGSNLLGGRVTILGGGGITTSLVRLLQPFAATSPSSAGGPRILTASTTSSTPTAMPTPCRAPTSSWSPWP